MDQLVIDLKELPLVQLYGENNEKINKISSLFSDIKITARGEILRAEGEQHRLKHFEKFMSDFMDRIERDEEVDLHDLEEQFEFPETNTKEDFTPQLILHTTSGKPITTKGYNQYEIYDSVKKNALNFVIGPAGTGKTYLAVAMAVKALKNKEVSRIVLTRPAVEAGENLGFLPGDMKEKLDPYLQPLYDALHDFLHSEKIKDYIEKRIIEIAPLAFMRGRTLDSAFVILDEAQNTTHSQMKMFLTRMGKDSKFLINGDISQIDLPHHQKSGLAFAIKNLEDVKGISVIRLAGKDVHRHPLVKEIIKRYDKA